MATYPATTPAHGLGLDDTHTQPWCDCINDLNTRLGTVETGVVVSSYVATWTSTGTAPAIGNGTIAGAYQLGGGWARVWGKLVAGSTTTFGTGTYELSLPVAYNANMTLLGQVYLRDSGLGDYFGVALVGSTTSKVAFRNLSGNGTNAIWSPTVPITFGNLDNIHWVLHYQT